MDGSPTRVSHNEGAERAAEANLKAFNEDYKHISTIMQES